MVALAQDLIDTIIDEVAAKRWFDRKNYGDLAACSLTARAFVAPSQRHLFRSLTLSTDNGHGNDGWPQELGAESWQVLTDSPHLGSYVRDFHLDMSTTAMSTLASLASLIPLLSGVNRLAIVCIHHYKWEKFPVGFRTALVSLFSLPSLRCVALTNYYGVPSSLIRHALVSYKEVSFRWVTIGSNEELFPCDRLGMKSLPSAAPLDHLALRYHPDRFAFHAHALLLDSGIASSLKHIRQLELTLPLPKSLGTLPPVSLGDLEAIALSYSDLIENLVINLGGLRDNPIVLPNLSHLCRLTLKASVRKLYVPDSVLTAMTSLPACTPALEVVNVLIYASFEERYDFNHQPDVDKALENLPRIKEVHFRVSCAGQGHFGSRTRRMLFIANNANLLTFSDAYGETCYSYWHPMADFSN
ncbi:hypothetical protein GGX14DRAFT_442851 [Mycena pura]|uniref:Uncharacterized protein n=1 Tax=Mycena pura TaxID=153505 RepID=A0AAD6VSU3_9AGAR|nr:hypothetical protein GGX14DRAFT_442851 [Mycena pura]